MFARRSLLKYVPVVSLAAPAAVKAAGMARRVDWQVVGTPIKEIRVWGEAQRIGTLLLRPGRYVVKGVIDFDNPNIAAELVKLVKVG